jgi:hypothetical protein
MAVPEASMHENDDPMARQHDIGRSGKIAPL